MALHNNNNKATVSIALPFYPFPPREDCKSKHCILYLCTCYGQRGFSTSLSSKNLMPNQICNCDVTNINTYKMQINKQINCIEMQIFNVYFFSVFGGYGPVFFFLKLHRYCIIPQSIYIKLRVIIFFFII